MAASVLDRKESPVRFRKHLLDEFYVGCAPWTTTGGHRSAPTAG